MTQLREGASEMKFALVAFASGCALALAPTSAQAEVVVLGFEDVPTPFQHPVTGMFRGPLPSPYAGFGWATNWGGDPGSPIPAGFAGVYQNTSSQPSGYQSAIPGGTRALYTPSVSDDPNLITITRNESWNFHYAGFAAAWNAGLTVEITGLLAGQVRYSIVTTLTAAGVMNVVTANFMGIDALTIRSSGGTTAYPGNSGAHLIVDDFAYSIPSAGTLVVAGIFGTRRDRRR